jgi:hypothetical protein
MSDNPEDSKSENEDEGLDISVDDLFEDVESSDTDMNNDPEEVKYELSVSDVTARSIGVEEEEHEIPEYAENIPPRDVVAGDIHCIQIELTNTGEHNFPGGRLDDVSIRQNFGSISYPDTYTTIPEIEIDESETISIHLTISASGALTLVGSISSSDEEHTRVGGLEELNEMVFGIRSVEREKFQIINKLDKIIEEL